MARSTALCDVWYLYVIICEDRSIFAGITRDIDRRLHEQFSLGRKTSKYLLKNKPNRLLKKRRFKYRSSAKKQCDYINSLTGSKRENYIIKSLLKPKPAPIVNMVSSGKYEVICPGCKAASLLQCSNNNYEVEIAKFKCAHELIREKIDSLFEQAILGAGCIVNGKFMFEGKVEDRINDFALGYSDRSHRKRTMAVYLILDEIAFKNSYLLLSSILEESYYIIQQYSDKSQYSLEKDYTNFSFRKNKNDTLDAARNIRFRKVALFTRSLANVLKHTGGIIENSGSGKILIEDFKMKNGLDVVLYRNDYRFNQMLMEDIFEVIPKLYVFITDLVAFLFNYKSFRARSANRHLIENMIVNYQVRDSFKDFLQSVQRDGSVMFMNLE